jgi:hypothetical protein
MRGTTCACPKPVQTALSGLDPSHMNSFIRLDKMMAHPGMNCKPQHGIEDHFALGT